MTVFDQATKTDIEWISKMMDNLNWFHYPMRMDSIATTSYVHLRRNLWSCRNFLLWWPFQRSNKSPVIVVTHLRRLRSNTWFRCGHPLLKKMLNCATVVASSSDSSSKPTWPRTWTIIVIITTTIIHTEIFLAIAFAVHFLVLVFLRLAKPLWSCCNWNFMKINAYNSCNKAFKMHNVCIYTLCVLWCKPTSAYKGETSAERWRIVVCNFHWYSKWPWLIM